MKLKRALQDIQADFQAYVLDAASGSLEPPAIMADIAEQYGLKAIDRLAIYHNAYRFRLRDALSEAFGKTHGYIGDDAFAELGAAYVQTHPSHYRNLRWYGEHFPAYLAQALQTHPIAGELAAFEWALGLAFDAADAPLVSADDIRSLDAEDWERIGFHLQPSAQFLTMQWNAPAIWLALEQDEMPPDAIAAEEAVPWLVWRKELRPHFRSLDRYEMRALQGLHRGLSFSAVCAAAAEEAGDQDIAAQIGGWLQRWLNEGVLAGINHEALPVF